MTTLFERFDPKGSDEESPIKYITGLSYNGSVCVVSFRHGEINLNESTTVQNASDSELFWLLNKGVDFYPVPYQEILSNLKTYKYERKLNLVLDYEKVKNEIEQINRWLITHVFPVGEFALYRLLLKTPPQRIYGTKINYHVRACAASLFLAMKEKRFALPSIAYGLAESDETLQWDDKDPLGKNFTIVVLTDNCLFDDKGLYFLPPNSCFEFLSIDYDKRKLNVRAIEYKSSLSGTGVTQTEKFDEWMRKKGSPIYTAVSPNGTVYHLKELEGSFQRNFID